MSSIPTGNRHYYYGGAEKISKYIIFVGVAQCSHNGEIVQTWYILALIIFHTLQSVTTVSVKYKKSVKSQIFSPFFLQKNFESTVGGFIFFFFTWKLPKHEPQGTPGKVT